jgi:hypothetical protein
MPNWCQNVVKISHADPVKMDIIRAADNKDNFFNTFIPCPQDLIDTVSGYVREQEALEAKQAANLEKYGYNTWYDHNIAKWGTKWDVVPRITEDNTNQITMTFDTAWSPPIEFYRAIIEEHGFEIMAFYNEEGMAYAGVFDNGHNEYYEYSGLNSDEIEEYLPFDLNEIFNISANKADWEDQEMDENQPDEEQEWHDFNPEC